MRRLIALLAALAIAGCATAPPPPPPAVPPAPAMADSTHLVVTLEGGAEDAAAATLAARHGLEFVAEWPLAAIGVRCLVFRATGDPAAALAALAADPAVRLAQPMQAFVTSSQSAEPALPQPNLARIGAAAAHQHITGAGVRVAVIDTAADLAHPDLRAGERLFRDFVDVAGAAAPEPHGTAMVGLIAARGRMTGVAPGAALLALRGCWESGGSGRCSTVSLARALNFAILNGAQVISLSLSGPPDPLLAALLDRAAGGGALLVAAGPGFPASHPAVLAAGPGGLAAPDADVLSTAPAGRYAFVSGASVAAAQVAGAAALLRAAAPEAAADALRVALAGPPGRKLDICAALLRATGTGCRGD